MNEAVYAGVAEKLHENEAYHRNHDIRFRQTIRWVDPPSGDGECHLLDIGCWPGYLSMYFKACGWNVDAIDLKPDRIPQVTDVGVRVTSHNLNDDPCLPYDANSFDTILFTEVFEHLNPASFGDLFASLGKVIKPGGQLILTTPNRLALNKSLFVPNRWSEPEVDEEGHGHWKEYLLSEVVDCFKGSGLKVSRSETVSFYSQLGRSNETGYFPLSDWREHPNKVRNLAKIVVNPLRNLALFRDSLVVIAKKPVD
jgi:SAM-dependent methyltransferase